MKLTLVSVSHGNRLVSAFVKVPYEDGKAVVDVVTFKRILKELRLPFERGITITIA